MADSRGRYRLGVDVGGTFTDLVLLDTETGGLAFGKVLTTPADPSAGILDGVARLLRQSGARPDRVEHVIHATTLVGNAVIEGKGARTALVTTRGFRDVLTLGREFRYDIYEPNLVFPAPLVPRRDRIEVAERLDAAGTIREPLTPAEVDRAVGAVLAGGYEAVAVCLLHAHRNPVHERRLGEALRAAAPALAVTTSADVLPQSGEYERTCAAVINAFVQPLIRAYIARLEAGLRELGLSGELYLLASNGGLLTAATAARFPVWLLESGPSAGALGAGHHGLATGRPDLLAFDMGGTTAKACVVRDGAPSTTVEFEVARVQRLTKGSGLPIKLPAIDMLEIGAGGGSIARVDPLGLISVGPDSAGADPGPACYGRRRTGTADAPGGSPNLGPTVTDANLLLGYLNPDYFLGGELPLDVGAAREAVAALGRRAGLSVERTALGIHEIVSQTMASALRTHAIEQGVDYRRLALVAFGGAGPVHAHRVGELLKIRTIVFPRGAGVFSAIGLLSAPLRFDLVRNAPARLDAVDPTTVAAIFAEMERELAGIFDEAGIARSALTLVPTADLRYVGQGTEIETPVPPGGGDPAEVADRFAAAYAGRYGRAIHAAPVEVVNWRLSARGAPPRFALGSVEPAAGGEARRGTRPVYLSAEAGFRDCAVYDRYRLPVGGRIEGPALVEERECTVFVGPGAVAEVDETGSLVMRLGGD